MEQENLNSTIDDEPGAMPSINKNNADGRFNLKSHGLLTDKLLADLNKGGALEQLSEFLTHHVKSDALRDFKGHLLIFLLHDVYGGVATGVAVSCRRIDWPSSI
nr:unnamed protein product [Spirometra erinaceieuropaei]